MTFAAMLMPLWAKAYHKVYDQNVKTLQVVVNQDWLSMPVMTLNSTDVLNVSFDELSHEYHRYVYRLERCEADWSAAESVFESDWLEGFNNNPIESYENSVNTTVLYTHYRLQLPNERCRLIMSGNYRLHVVDEDSDTEVLCAEFRVVEPLMNVGISVTTNTDMGFNTNFQQASMTVNYNSVNVSNPQEQIYTVVMQNGREDTQKQGIRPDLVQPNRLQWEHNRQLIFDAGNEFRKYEVLSLKYPTMGIDRIQWDGGNYHVYPFVSEPRRNYVYDEDTNGAFFIRNSDNQENDYTCDYVYVHYKLMPAPPYGSQQKVVVRGAWTTEAPQTYQATYDPADQSYNLVVLQKQGYYSYQYLLQTPNGRLNTLPEEGSFFETENKYQAFVYYKGISDRTWRLLGYQQVTIR